MHLSSNGTDSPNCSISGNSDIIISARIRIRYSSCRTRDGNPVNIHTIDNPYSSIGCYIQPSTANIRERSKIIKSVIIPV